MDLVDFLNARLDEEEDRARDAARGNPGPWSVDHSWIRNAAGETVVHDEYHWGTAAFEHIARYDPARVLREVAAKRRLLQISLSMPGTWDEVPEGVNPEAVAADNAERKLMDDVLREIAAVWSDHPDYPAATAA